MPKMLGATLLAAAGLFALPALAQGSAAVPSGQRDYQQELAACAQLPQDPAACRREVGAARDAARKGQLTSQPSYRANALARCAAHPPEARAECEARIMGTGQTTVQGSVLGGGVIRETVTTTLVPAPAAPPAPQAQPQPRAVSPTTPVPITVTPTPAMPAPHPPPISAPRPLR